MADLNDLANFVDRMAVRIPVATNDLKKGVTRTILASLTQTTPADTGQAISNWQTSLDTPIETTRSAFSPSPKGRMINGVWTHAVDPIETAHANAPPTYDEGVIIIDSAQPEQSIFISNILPYIKKLDQGSSKQAPEGFIDQAFLLAKSVLARARLAL
jgi:hypothetical protein